MDNRDLTSGDPLGEPTPPAERPAAAPPPPPLGAPERPGAYGGGPVPPGAVTPGFRPQRIGPDAQYAEWWRRVLAAIVDGVILGGITLLVLAGLGLGLFADGDAGVGDLIVGALVGTAVFAFVAFLYAPLLMARTNGQTLGRMVAGCRVVRANGRDVDFLWAAAREVLVKGLLVGIAGSLTGGIAYLVDVLWPLVDGENRALHDFVVDSRVVRA